MTLTLKIALFSDSTEQDRRTFTSQEEEQVVSSDDDSTENLVTYTHLVRSLPEE